MRKGFKKSFLATAMAALGSAGLLMVGSAGAASRQLLVRLPTGDIVTATVDGDPCAPASSLPVPGGLPPGSQVVGASGGADCNAAGPQPDPDRPAGLGGEAQDPTGSDERVKRKAQEPGRGESRARRRGAGGGPTGGVRARRPKSRFRGRGGAPTRQNPTFFESDPGPQELKAIPNFTIRHFRIPLFLMPIYQAAGIQYGIR